MILCIGAIVGAYSAGLLANAIGRRKTLMVFDACVILGGLITNINNYAAIMIGRFISGLSVGGNNVMIPIYVNEISPTVIIANELSDELFSVCVEVSMSYCNNFKNKSHYSHF